VGVLNRGTSGEFVQWYDVDPCYVFHVVNAFDDADGALVADLYCYDRTFDTGQGGLLGSTLPRLERWRMARTGRRVERTVLCDRPAEFPRVDGAVATRPYHHAYAAKLGRQDGLDTFPGYVKIDAQRGTTTHVELPSHLQGGEPIFVRADDGRTGKAEARIELPVRVPFGFHGAFLDGTTIS
jgi:carotenoid cleavage dioxygenase